MIPWVVARELRATLLDYLRSTWSLGDAREELALFRFLAGPQGIFQGPYLRLSLPFEQAPLGAAAPLDVLPSYRPHLHQLQAWQRLSSRARAPQATLITTGTGSGKTECFLFPILDHALRAVSRGESGIKAIILYPMNALASDQAQRFADTIWKDERLRGRVRVGLFVGGEGQHRDMGRDHVVDVNDVLRGDPPDILLTNYRMLDLLLQRPRDAALWAKNGPDTLRYLVLDELHTYDGAQGTDVACLIRRLGKRLGNPEAICPVGTSATVGGGGDTRTELLKFAGTLFDQQLPDDAFIGETRVEPRQLVGDEVLPETYPDAPGPWPEAGEDAVEHVRACVEAWLPPAARKEILDKGPLDRVALGTWVVRVPIVRTLIQLAHRRPAAATQLVAELAKTLPGFAAADEAHREGWLAAAMSMLSFAQRRVDDLALPLVSVQATLWVREVRRMLSRIGAEPAYRFYDDNPPSSDEAWAPRYACQDCGHVGWLVTESGPGQTLGFDYKDVARAYMDRAARIRLVFAEPGVAPDDARTGWIDARRRRFLDKDPNDGSPKVVIVEPEAQGKPFRCPACDARDTIRLLAARGTTLSSVAVGHLFTTPLNTDRKLLTFSDSVQDAAHRAGFFGARTYRFVVRTALLAAIPREGTMPLGALGDRAWEHWSTKLGVESAAAVLLPTDLHWLQSVEDWHAELDEHVRRVRDAEARGETHPLPTPAPSDALLRDLQSRLRWEAARELGVATRIGRTLEQTGCISVTVDPKKFGQAFTAIKELLPEKLGVMVGVGDEAVRAWLVGLLTRLRLRGGVWDPLLKKYVESGGNSYMLTKKETPLMSSFPRETSRPLFLTNAPRARKFDSIASPKKQNWARDWFSRVFEIDADPGTAAAAYAVALPILAREGILTSIPTSESAANGKALAWGLLADVLHVSRAHVFRRCTTCGYELAAVEGSVTDPLGHRCLRYRCTGTLEAVQAREGWEERFGLPSATYYQRAYERGQLGRLWSREHTGLLARAQREDLELEFKQRPRPDSPNLLSCTPTLEMGIDIGDLSATLLCSVPPGTANYVQRVGRAGRKTGNALVLAFAATRPHDLYFFQQPIEAMAGAIHPPGCYLSAPEVLKRQAIAYCFDGYARSGGKLPGRVKEAILGDESKRFPKPLLEWIAPRRAELRASFLELFKGALTVNAVRLMEAYFTVEADGLTPLERRLQTTTEATRNRREELRKLAQKLDERRRQLDTDEVEQKKVADLEDEKRRLGDEKKFVAQQLLSLVEQDLWGWLCEESVLPNYAFPERGVKLDAYVRREGQDREPEHHEIIRAPATALREFAPFNTFYARARRVPIAGVELKRESTPTEWVFCQSCHHAAPHATTQDASHCPNCGDPGWGDVGRRRAVATLGQVFAFARHRDAVLGDDADDRERKSYYTLALFEAQSEATDAWANDAAGFGFELQPRLTLRELNLGLREDGSSPQTMQIAGQTLPEVKFSLCESCGQAQPPPTMFVADHAKHRPWCPERRKPEDRQRFRDLHLLRELRSEALRLVVPISDAEDAPTQLANLRAALRLGLRRFYGGEPDFLDVRVYDEPLPGREGRRRFLVVMDRVPGGTGLLAELAKDKGAKLKEAFEHAHTALRSCECQRREPPAKACYQCLYAYREGEDLPLLDRVVALELIEQLLDAYGALTRVDTIGSMSQSSVLESELEKRFVVALRARIEEREGTFEQVQDGEWKLQVGKRKWLMRGQVELGADVVKHPCRADFMLYPEERGARKIAVFTDGLAYHVMPGSERARLGDDAQKRHGISMSDELMSWSLTWKDVVSPDAPALPNWFGDGAQMSQLESLAARFDQAGRNDAVQTALRVVNADPVRGLVAVLESANGVEKLARGAAFLLLQRGRRQRSERIAHAHEAWRTTSTAEVQIDESAGDLVATVPPIGEHAKLLLDLPNARLGTLMKDKEGPRLTLRLEDEPTRRSNASYETSWRLWLRAWNLLQLLPGAVLVTRDSAAPSLGGVVAEQAPPPARSDDARLKALDELLDEHARVVIRDLLVKHPSLPAPVTPYEVRGELNGDVELAWPVQRVAAYFDKDKDLAEALRTRGWTVLALERKPALDELERALGLVGR